MEKIPNDIEIRRYYVFAVTSISTDVSIKLTKLSVWFLGIDVKLYIPTMQNIACWIISFCNQYKSIYFCHILPVCRV